MFLSPSAICLLGLIAWTLLLVFLLVSQRGLLVLGGRMAVNAFAADGSNTPGGFGQRLVRVHANCVENLPLLAGALLYAIASGQSSLTDPLAPLVLGARLFQSLMHLVSTSALFVWLRFAGFFVQLLVLAWWLLLLAGWFSGAGSVAGGQLLGEYLAVDVRSAEDQAYLQPLQALALLPGGGQRRHPAPSATLWVLVKHRRMAAPISLSLTRTRRSAPARIISSALGSGVLHAMPSARRVSTGWLIAVPASNDRA